MSQLIRIAQGQLTANALLSDDTTLVANWTRTDDMQNKSFVWSASQPEFGLQAEYVRGLGLGTGRLYGGFSGVVSFFVGTVQMRQYLWETLMSSQPSAQVTVYLHAPNISLNAFDFDEFEVFYGEFITPMASNAETTYTRFDDRHYHTMQFLFTRGTVVTLSLLVDENGVYIVDENGTYISLED